MLEALLKEHGGELLSSLTGAGGLDQGQAENLLPPALGGISDALQNGGLDLSSLLGGGNAAADLLKQLNIGDIASSAGLSEHQAKSGLASLVPAVMSLLNNKASGPADLLAMLGGGEGASGALGAIGGIAGKLFGK